MKDSFKRIKKNNTRNTQRIYQFGNTGYNGYVKKKLVINVPGNPKEPLIYKKITKKITKQVIHVPINPALPLKLIIKKLTAYGYKWHRPSNINKDA